MLYFDALSVFNLPEVLREQFSKLGLHYSRFMNALPEISFTLREFTYAFWHSPLVWAGLNGDSLLEWLVRVGSTAP